MTAKRKKPAPPKSTQKAALDADLRRCVLESQKPRPEPVKQEDLPPGWEVCKSQYGSVYYHNNASGEKRWDPPILQMKTMCAAKLT